MHFPFKSIEHGYFPMSWVMVCQSPIKKWVILHLVIFVFSGVKKFPPHGGKLPVAGGAGLVSGVPLGRLRGGVGVTQRERLWCTWAAWFVLGSPRIFCIWTYDKRATKKKQNALKSTGVVKDDHFLKILDGFVWRGICSNVFFLNKEILEDVNDIPWTTRKPYTISCHV